MKNHYYAFGERDCSSHTKWLVGEVKRNVRPAVQRGAAMESKHFERQPKCFCGKIERITGTTYEYHFYIKDHLGNVRVVFKSGPTLISEHHFYPLGERIRSSHTKWLVDEVKRSFRPAAKRGAISVVKTLCATAKVLLRKNQEGSFYTSGTSQKYKYNGKELVGSLGWYDYGARYYNPTLGIFHSIDRFAEKFPWQSPYIYASNNPIRFIDINGDSTRVYVFDQANRPADNGTSGTSYTAEIYVYDDQTYDLNGPYSGSSYPNSISNTNNSTKSNTANEGEHKYNNRSGHKGGTKQGLNLVNNSDQRKTPGTNPNGDDVMMQYVNVHSGASNKGNYSSRGSEGCVTICPDDVQSFFSNFDWSGGTTGNSTGKIIIERGDKNASVQKLKENREELLKFHFHEY